MPCSNNLHDDILVKFCVEDVVITYICVACRVLAALPTGALCCPQQGF